MPEDEESASQSGAPPILDPAEAARRTFLLSELRSALEVLGICGVLARNHRLVLRYNDAPLEPSGLTDPELRLPALHGFSIITTDGSAYAFADGRRYPVGDLPAVAAEISQYAAELA